MRKFFIRIMYFFYFLQLLFLGQNLKKTKNKNKNDTHHSEGLEGKNHKGISSASGAPVEYVCFSHQSSLFSVLFNLFTFGPYWRGTVYWFIVPRFLRVPLRAHLPPTPPPHNSPLSLPSFGPFALTLSRLVAGFCFKDGPGKRGEDLPKRHRNLTGVIKNTKSATAETPIVPFTFNKYRISNYVLSCNYVSQ